MSENNPDMVPEASSEENEIQASWMDRIKEKNVYIPAIVMLLVIAAAVYFFFLKGPSVTTLPGGLRYVDDVKGTGREVKKGDLVSIHFKGWIVADSNNLFKDWSKDSTRMQYSLGDSRERGVPYKFILNTEGFVKGSDEGIIGMKKGGTRTIIIPANLAYGPRGFGPIPPNASLKLVITVMDIKDKVTAKLWDVDTTKAIVTKSGLKYVILQQGKGANADSGRTVTIHYSGYLADGKKFDSSIERDEPLQVMLGVGMVIPGLEEGLKYLNKGSKARIIIPASLAYKDKAVGIIPANSNLYFDIEVIDIR